MDIQDKIQNWIKETLGIEEEISLSHPTHLQNGDFTFVSKNPEGDLETLRQAQGDLHGQIEKIEIAHGRYINFFLSQEFFADEIRKIAENYGQNDLLKGEKTIIEFTDPNPFKEFHIGHLMSNTIGESVSRIVEGNGAVVKRANYQGDVGLHVAKAIWGKMKKTDMAWGEAYAYESEQYDENKEEINEINKKIYDKTDEKINELYIFGRKYSLEYFEKIYEKLGTKFDYYFFESEVGEFGKEIVLEFLKKGIFEESGGAIVFRGEKRDPKLHTRVFVNSIGLPVYEAKELGLAKIKYDKYSYDKSIIITGNEINEYFKVLLVAMKEVFPELAVKTMHLSHGMLKLPTGKMSSRTGSVITAESLIDQVKEKVLEKLKDRNFDIKEKENIAEVVAVGAIKYSILRQAVGGDIVFDFEKSISFEGDSGPYLQYTYTRAKSVLGKAQLPTSNFQLPKTWQTTEVERLLYRFPEVVERAGREYSPHHLITYLTELSGAFNNFYAREKILDTPDSDYKLAITSAVAHILKNGLNLLGIKTLEKM